MNRIFVGQDVNEPKRTDQIIQVKSVKPHPKYSTRNSNDDLMILILEKDVKGVTPRQIAPSTLVQKATDVRAVGFGTTDRQAEEGFGIKRMTDVPIASNSCDGTFDGEDDSTVYGCYPGLELIAGKPLLNKDTCQGDSGGPIYVSDVKNSWYLAGVTSRATELRTDLCGDGGVYVRADKYLDWIKSIPGVTLSGRARRSN
jgi:secreted trypsin-like serine protease